MIWKVIFTQYNSYEVYADNPEDAKDIAYYKFRNDAYRISCPADYDEVYVTLLHIKEEGV